MVLDGSALNFYVPVNCVVPPLVASNQ